MDNPVIGALKEVCSTRIKRSVGALTTSSWPINSAKIAVLTVANARQAALVLPVTLLLF